MATPPLLNGSGDTAQIAVFPTTPPQSSETADLVHRVRDDVIPTTLSGSSAQAYVGGQTAANEDVASKLIGRFGLFLLFVVCVTCLVLTMAFRSIVIALKATLATSLSALAAFGVLVAVFQWGWAQGLVGLDSTGPTASFLPVIVLSILFGLSMDYEVFLASRIREEYVRGGHARHAVTGGVRGVGRVIVAAAVIMGVVFWAFVLTDDRTGEVVRPRSRRRHPRRSLANITGAGLSPRRPRRLHRLRGPRRRLRHLSRLRSQAHRATT